MDRYNLTNRNGLVAKITNLGGHLTDPTGRHRAGPQHAGAVPRPQDQPLLRLDRRPVRQPDHQGKFTIDGKQYTLDARSGAGGYPA